MTDRRLSLAPQSKAPVVDFTTPTGPIALAAAERARVAGLLDDMEAGIRDIRTYSAEGRWNAECAIVWASGLLLADGVRAILTSFDKRAAVLFRAQDRAIEQAEKIMKLVGKGLATREDQLKTVDGALQPVAKSIATVRSTQAWLKEHGAKAPPQTERLLQTGLILTSDVVLILDGFRERDKALQRGSQQEAQFTARLAKLRMKIRQLDAEYGRLVLQGEKLSRIA